MPLPVAKLHFLSLPTPPADAFAQVPLYVVCPLVYVFAIPLRLESTHQSSFALSLHPPLKTVFYWPTHEGVCSKVPIDQVLPRLKRLRKLCCSLIGNFSTQFSSCKGSSFRSSLFCTATTSIASSIPKKPDEGF